MDASGALDAARVVGLPAIEIARLVRSGEVTAVDVVRAHLAHIDAVDARVGAFRVVRRDAALAEAHAIDTALTRFALPLAGVPIAVKDNVAVAGEVCTDGSAACADEPATRDHPVVSRLRKAGAIVVGITRVPELCLYGATDGPGSVSRNPWDTARSPAGSSGGSAAAVASGSVPLAHGNDGMGSLRLPAAACGLVTLKPGAVSSRPRSVPTAGRAWPRTARWRPPSPTSPSRTPCWRGRSRGRCRAGPAAADRALHPLAGPGGPRRRGHPGAVDAWSPSSRPPGTRRAEGPADHPGAAARTVARWMVGADDDAEALDLDPAAMEPRSRTHARLGGWSPGRDGPAAHRRRFRARMVDFFTDVDLLLTPVVTGPPLPARPWHERSFLANVTANARWAPWTSAWNLAGLPALVLPAGAARRAAGRRPVGRPGGGRKATTLAGRGAGAPAAWRRYAPVFDPAAPPVAAPV